MSRRLPPLRPRRDDGVSPLLRGAGRFLAVAAAAGATGALLGVGFAALIRDDADPSPSPSPSTIGAPTTASEATAAPAVTVTTTTSATTTVPATSSGGKLRIDVLSTIAHPVTAPAGDTRRRARVSVHVRVTNGTDRRISPAPPMLLVGDARLQIAPGSSGEAGALLAALDPAAVADGRLRFDTEGAVTAQLTTGRVRLQIAGKILPLTPVVGSATAP